MVSGSRVVCLLGLCLLGATAVTPGFAALDESPPPQTAQADTDITQRIVVELQTDGDARWTITKRVNLTSRNETRAFEDLASDFENGETGDLGLAAYRRAARLASGSTDRAMRITNVTRRASQSGTATNGTGKLSISFTWTNFGRVTNQTLHVDDVFTTEQGLWLEGLTEHQRLVVVPPQGYEFFDAPSPVTLRNGTIQWTGPQDFDPNTLSATFKLTRVVSTPNGTPTGPTTGGSGALLWVGLVALAGAVAVVGYALTRGDDLPDLPTGSGGSTTESTDGGTTPAASDGDGTGQAAAEPDDAGDDEADDAIDEELLSDEERVERLLEENGGRMKQADIVKETGWSNAKVSQLLSAMEEEGRIDKLRIGRENLISFPDEDVADLEE